MAAQATYLKEPAVGAGPSTSSIYINHHDVHVPLSATTQNAVASPGPKSHPPDGHSSSPSVTTCTKVLIGAVATATCVAAIGSFACGMIMVLDKQPTHASAPASLFASRKAPREDNPCAGSKPTAEAFDNRNCTINAVEQAGGNVTKGFEGLFDTEAEPIDGSFYNDGLCVVNVHWHLGSEHLSVGEFDETGTGPSDIHDRRRAAGKVRQGYQCKLYNPANPSHTAKYDWKHCVGMEVGQTYEVHWPHSKGGACGTIHQYQSPFYDGVFCNSGSLKPSTEASIGVQSQVFVVVNDEAFYYPDLMRGMLVNGHSHGVDVGVYTGSTTGTTRDNSICSAYAPITWHVDRKCHPISASSFDKMCADMKAQNDDMSEDLHPHGSRELVTPKLQADNLQDKERAPLGD